MDHLVLSVIRSHGWLSITWDAKPAPSQDASSKARICLFDAWIFLKKYSGQMVGFDNGDESHGRILIRKKMTQKNNLKSWHWHP